jgi:dihydroneopterin aldolase
MIVELHGVELYGYHGVNESEKELGQLFLYDVWLDVGARAPTTGSTTPSTIGSSPRLSAR